MTMPNTPVAGRSMTAWAALLLAMVVAGLALFFWLGPSTPVVATPATQEVAP